ncbi:unnamed protein product [marine sediment metagenome]|uniref:Thymidylate kinase-like domain-containing protein n=1 Tax=marine sediment metagenome TaxID=412755 RepID=X0XGI8_9ZZZZ
MSSIKVIALEGIHGVGKTTLMEKFKNLEKINDYTIILLDESFVKSPDTRLHPQKIVPEFIWAGNWFSRLLRFCHPYFDGKTGKYNGKIVVIADRSPYSACVYPRDVSGILLQPVIDSMVMQLRKDGVDVKIYYISDGKSKVMDRIKKRLEDPKESLRKKFTEDNEEWFNKVLKLYNVVKESCKWETKTKDFKGGDEQYLKVLINKITTTTSN